MFNKDSSIFFASLPCLPSLDDDAGKNKNQRVSKASVKHRIYIELRRNPFQEDKTGCLAQAANSPLVIPPWSGQDSEQDHWRQRPITITTRNQSPLGVAKNLNKTTRAK